jgi:hypothetical protein
MYRFTCTTRGREVCFHVLACQVPCCNISGCDSFVLVVWVCTRLPSVALFAWPFPPTQTGGGDFSAVVLFTCQTELENQLASGLVCVCDEPAVCFTLGRGCRQLESFYDCQVYSAAGVVHYPMCYILDIGECAVRVCSSDACEPCVLLGLHMSTETNSLSASTILWCALKVALDGGPLV